MGIKTDNPDADLHIAGDGRIKLQQLTSGGNEEANFDINAGGDGKLYIENKIYSTAPFTIDKNDNIGIGDTSPDAKLDVAGSFRLDGTFADKDGDVGTVGQILSSTATGTNWIANKQIKQLTGRSYLYSDERWTTWGNNSYGINYYQWNSSCGTGTNPNCSWAALGLWMPKGTRITGITVSGRANSTEVTDIEQVWQFRYPNPATRWETGVDNNSEDISEDIYRNFWWNNSTAGQPAFSGNINDIHKRHYDVNYVTPEDGYIDQVVRAGNNIASNRYFYGSTTIEYILPSDL